MSDDKFQNPWGGNNGNKNDGDELDEMIKRGQEKIIDFLNAKKKHGGGGGHGGSKPPQMFNFFGKNIVVVLALVAAVMWLSTGFYTIQPDEEGVVLRFGKYSRSSIPGLNYKLPSPFETVEKVSITRINKEEIGFRSLGRRIETREQLLEGRISKESQMLTGDENIVDINFDVQWMISDAKKYLFNVRDLSQENTVKSSAESAMREIIGLSNISDVLAEERSSIEMQAKGLLQEILDNYDMGIKVVRVQLLRSEPPPEVIDAYRDVQSAKADKERIINQAYAYRNDIVPKARGEAEQVLQEAEGYKRQVIAEAQGESERFKSIYSEYRKAKDVTRKRMYLEAMEDVLEGMDKIIIDKRASGGMVPYLPLDKLVKTKPNTQQ